MRKRRTAGIAVGVLVLMASTAYLLRYHIWHLYSVRTNTCTSISIAAVTIRPLIDASTGAEIPYPVARRGRLIVTDGAYVDTTSLPGFAAANRPGTYTVAVRLAGYQEWRRSGVRAPRRPCAVQTAQLRAVLHRAP